MMPKLFEFLQTYLHLSHGDIVLDIGFGHAMPLYYWSIFYNCKCIGVEIDDIRYTEALAIKNLFTALFKPHSAQQIKNTVLLQGNIDCVTPILGHIQVIFLLNTCFAEVNNFKISETIQNSEFSGKTLLQSNCYN